MALKDWKKAKGNVWINEKNNSIIDFGKGIFQYKEKYILNIFKDNKRIVNKSFKTRLQALKYAKAYMKKH